jgi:uncharacterized protein YkwD
MSLAWGFRRSSLDFLYEDDLFRFTAEPGYAAGGWDRGALRMELGGRDKKKVEAMSGGWTKAFELEEDAAATLSFRYRIDLEGKHKKKNYAEVLAALDGEALGAEGADYVDRLHGRKGEKDLSTGWRTVEIELGELEAGAHELALGGYLEKKKKKKAAEIAIDDVRIELGTEAEPDPAPALGAFEREVIELTNAYRAEHGRAPLAANAALSAAAEDWSGEMARGDFFRHSDVARQVAAFGYDAAGYGENIAAGQRSPEAVVDAWIASPGHRANLLRDGFEDIGVGYVFRANDGGDAPYGHYWTQIFGVPAGDGLI